MSLDLLQDLDIFQQIKKNRLSFKLMCTDVVTVIAQHLSPTTHGTVSKNIAKLLRVRVPSYPLSNLCA